jgi:ubiquitin-protein ligase
MTNPVQNRLRAEYEKVTRLVSESGGTLKLIQTAGSLPMSHIIEYHCPSLTVDGEGKLVIRHIHQAEFKLGITYPPRDQRDWPTVHMLTPVFNPHVWPNNAVCIGTWGLVETLDLLVLRIGALLQLDPRVLNANSPANLDANLWVQANRSKIPLGTISFKAGTEPAKRIQWS